MIIKNKYSKKDIVLILGDLNINAFSKNLPIEYLDEFEDLKVFY